jgi:hypothetical protein
VPTICKRAFITPIYKKKVLEVTNYRPISKLCIIAKVFERLVYKQIYSAISHSLGSFQHGFLKGRSTVTNMTLFGDFVTDTMSEGYQVDVIYTDYS